MVKYLAAYCAEERSVLAARAFAGFTEKANFALDQVAAVEPTFPSQEGLPTMPSHEEE